jgi:hypothetical protein
MCSIAALQCRSQMKLKFHEIQTMDLQEASKVTWSGWIRLHLCIVQTDSDRVNDAELNS